MDWAAKLCSIEKRISKRLPIAQSWFEMNHSHLLDFRSEMFKRDNSSVYSFSTEQDVELDE